jgi:pimeloyl-ACP methyl ester carboxylesterase
LVSGGIVGTKGATSLRQNLLPASIAAMRSEVEARFFDLPPMPDFMYERMMTEVARDIPAQSDMLDSVAKDEAHIRSKLGQIFNTLTVIIWGGKDQVVSKNYGETLHSQLPGSATAIFKDTGHDPHLEHPEEFDEAVLFFLKQKEGGR